MSGASNLGFGNISPVNYSPYVNGESSNWPGIFGSNTIPTACQKGGLKKKIKNITKRYKRMKKGSRKIRTLKRKIRSSFAKKGKLRKRTKGRRRSQRGGYSQYQNNSPFTPTFQVAGINLPASELGIANPPPIKVLPNCTNCVDNYNHFLGTGFSSKGN
jgi:hypothetical protein